MTNDTPPSRDDLADRMMDLALREKVGGKAPPDLSAQILAQAEQQVSLPESRRGARADSKYGRFAPVGVSLCLLGLALLSAVLFQPEAALKFASAPRDGELLRAYEVEQAALLKVIEQGDEATLLKAFEEQERRSLGPVDDAKRIVSDKILHEVVAALTSARKSGPENAEKSKRDLKLMLEVVERAPELDKDVRDSLRSYIESSFMETCRREIADMEKRSNNEEARAAALERQLLAAESILREAKVRLLTDRFNSLMNEERYEEAEGTTVQLPVLPPGLSSSSPTKKKKDTLGLNYQIEDARATNPQRQYWTEVSKERARRVAALDSPPPKVTLWNGQQRYDVPSSSRVTYSLNGKTYERLVPKTVCKSELADLSSVRTRLTEKRDELVIDVSRYKKQLDARGIHVEDPVGETVVANVKAEITAISGAKKLVEISVGSDDGIRAGHEMDVYRNAAYLGKVRVIKTTPDRAVAALVMESMRGPLLKGDKVGVNVALPVPADAEPVAEPVEREEPDPAGDKFDLLPENDFEKVKEAPLSTFSIDVDTASYSKVRQFLMVANQLPPGEAVRLEELVNYFPYDYAPPKDDKPFAAHVETAACPWNGEHRLVRIGLKGKVVEAAERPACNLVFLVDVSGSMDEPNKLPLVTNGLKMLAGELTDRDRVSIVVYAGAAGMVLPPTRGDARPTIYTALSGLKAGGSTNGGEGIELAYKTCQENFIEGGANRVILCTDGDFNVGLTSTGQLVDLAKEKAQKGVFLSVLGFGMGNHNDEMLEAVSNKANGNHAFIDSLNEARKVLVREISGTLVTIAKDVKIQVDFNPEQVASYRLLGYENRMLAAEDFADDKKDAGEIGGGHTVTALYEIVPAEKAAKEKGKLLTLKLRYKQPDGDTSSLLEFPIEDSGKRFSAASGDFQFAAAVASFGMILRKSKHAGDATLASVAEIATAAKGPDPHGYRAEFVELVKKAGDLAK